MRRRVIVLLCLSVLTISGCQRQTLILDSAVLTPADEAGAPPLRPGVWARASRECDYDPNKALTAWPDCVGYFVVRDHELRWAGSSEYSPMVLAGGYPRVLQEKTERGYEYTGLRAQGFDPQRRVVLMERWSLACPDDPATGSTMACEPRTAAELRGLAKASDDGGAVQWLWVREGTE